eukprot:gnl/Spiro4/12043_TR6351_c0_g1_i1.p1 gnl/Spiro4/12043_TR6351_c0_g1~~gnl/Spiro4/12043_TR6351_c0_g1_i1.p1  ORF type:complete len:594 (-),score=184.23 gnl/Spiro4/12043_TR6351_c0_g1_i1:218-1969(-)
MRTVLVFVTLAILLLCVSARRSKKEGLPPFPTVGLPPVDHHVHTSISDGEFCFVDVVLKARDSKLKELWLMDHDWSDAALTKSGKALTPYLTKNNEGKYSLSDLFQKYQMHWFKDAEMVVNFGFETTTTWEYKGVKLGDVHMLAYLDQATLRDLHTPRKATQHQAIQDILEIGAKVKQQKIVRSKEAICSVHENLVFLQDKGDELSKALQAAALEQTNANSELKERLEDLKKGKDDSLQEQIAKLEATLKEGQMLLKQINDRVAAIDSTDFGSYQYETCDEVFEDVMREFLARECPPKNVPSDLQGKVEPDVSDMQRPVMATILVKLLPDIPMVWTGMGERGQPPVSVTVDSTKIVIPFLNDKSLNTYAPYVEAKKETPYPPLLEICKLVGIADGLPVLAHMTTKNDDLRAQLGKSMTLETWYTEAVTELVLAGCPLYGLETFSSEIGPDEHALIEKVIEAVPLALAKTEDFTEKNFKLYRLYGSDFHGSTKPYAALGLPFNLLKTAGTASDSSSYLATNSAQLLSAYELDEDLGNRGEQLVELMSSQKTYLQADDVEDDVEDVGEKPKGKDVEKESVKLVID